MKVAIIPFYSTQLNNVFFCEDELSNRDGAREPFIQLKSYLELCDLIVNTVDILNVGDADKIVFFNLELKYLVEAFFSGKLKNSIYISFEPPVVRSLHKPENLKLIAKVFGRTLTWQDDLIACYKFKKFYFPMPRRNNNVKEIPFSDKKLITTIVGFKHSKSPNELYSHRIEAIRFLEKKYPDSFEFYGVGWDEDIYPNYKGSVDNKLEKLSEYKFSICYENECKINGLISEKIFDCFYAGVIPIFWGADNIQEYIPEECYIDKRDFKNYGVLCDYLENMSETIYSKRVAAIEAYLSSSNFSMHSSKSFANTIYNAIEQIDAEPVGVYDFLKLIIHIVMDKLNRFFSRKLSGILGFRW